MCFANLATIASLFTPVLPTSSARSFEVSLVTNGHATLQSIWPRLSSNNSAHASHVPLRLRPLLDGLQRHSAAVGAKQVPQSGSAAQLAGGAVRGFGEAFVPGRPVLARGSHAPIAPACAAAACAGGQSLPAEQHPRDTDGATQSDLMLVAAAPHRTLLAPSRAKVADRGGLAHRQVPKANGTSSASIHRLCGNPQSRQISLKNPAIYL
jgi:hypothetical protein